MIYEVFSSISIALPQTNENMSISIISIYSCIHSCTTSRRDFHVVTTKTTKGFIQKLVARQ